MNVHLTAGDALLVVDVQNDFLSGGSLDVPLGEEMPPVLNRYFAMFQERRLPGYARLPANMAGIEPALAYPVTI